MCCVSVRPASPCLTLLRQRLGATSPLRYERFLEYDCGCDLGRRGFDSIVIDSSDPASPRSASAHLAARRLSCADRDSAAYMVQRMVRRPKSGQRLFPSAGGGGLPFMSGALFRGGRRGAARPAGGRDIGRGSTSMFRNDCASCRTGTIVISSGHCSRCCFRPQVAPALLKCCVSTVSTDG